MFQEESQHLPPGIGSVWIGIRPGRIAARPRVAGAVDCPRLEDNRTVPLGVEGARIGMAPGNLAALDSPLQLPTGARLSENLLAVAWVHRPVAIAMEDDRRYHETWPWGGRSPNGGLAQPHGGESRGHIMGGTACEPGMHSDGRVEIGIRGAHDRRRSTTS